MDVSLPAYTAARLESNDFTDVSSTEFRADAVIALDGPDRPSAAIVAEVQLRPDGDKRFSWPVYLATLRARLRCPVLLLVISPSLKTAAWCEEPIDCGHPGWVLRPFTIGPDQIPKITDHSRATESPELALLSAVAHGNRPEGRKTLDAAAAAIGSIDQDRGRIYYDIVLAALPKAARRYLENLMTITDYEFQSEFALRNQAKGRREGRAQGRIEGKAEGLAEGRLEGQAAGEARALLTILATRGIAVSDDVHKRITSCHDLARLESWLTKALTVNTADELFS